MAQSRRIIKLDVDKLSDSDIKLIKADFPDGVATLVKEVELKVTGEEFAEGVVGIKGEAIGELVGFIHVDESSSAFILPWGPFFVFAAIGDMVDEILTVDLIKVGYDVGNDGTIDAPLVEEGGLIGRNHCVKTASFDDGS